MSRERKITELEQQQFGLVSVTQLKELGVSRFATYRRVNDDRHDRVRRGVLANPSVAVTFASRGHFVLIALPLLFGAPLAAIFRRRR